MEGHRQEFQGLRRLKDFAPGRLAFFILLDKVPFFLVFLNESLFSLEKTSE
jgi:hypothetical protein